EDQRAYFLVRATLIGGHPPRVLIDLVQAVVRHAHVAMHAVTELQMQERRGLAVAGQIAGIEAPVHSVTAPSEHGSCRTGAPHHSSVRPESNLTRPSQTFNAAHFHTCLFGPS